MTRITLALAAMLAACSSPTTYSSPFNLPDGGDTETETDTGSDSETGTDADSDTDSDSDTDTDTETESATETESETDSETDTGTDTGSDTGSEGCADEWLDPASGLIWQVAPPDVERNEFDAHTYCADLVLCGSSSWRMPGISELRSLIRGCPATETGGACGITDDCLTVSVECSVSDCYTCDGSEVDGCYWPDEVTFGGSACGLWWSVSYPEEWAGDMFWVVDMQTGTLTSTGAASEIFVRCVRGG